MSAHIAGAKEARQGGYHIVVVVLVQYNKFGFVPWWTKGFAVKRSIRVDQDETILWQGFGKFDQFIVATRSLGYIGLSMETYR